MQAKSQVIAAVLRMNPEGGFLRQLHQAVHDVRSSLLFSINGARGMWVLKEQCGREGHRRNAVGTVVTWVGLGLFSAVQGTRNVIECSCFGPEPNRGS